MPPVKSRGGDVVRNHGHIPDDRFRAHFGHDHSFRIDHPVIVDGRPHFGFGGFSFGIIAPWPAGWLYTDAVYVDSFGGRYYLCNPRHPGVRLALSVEDPAAPVQMADAGVDDNTVADNQDGSAGPSAITLGETPGQLVATLGSPRNIVDLGFRKIYVYQRHESHLHRRETE